MRRSDLFKLGIFVFCLPLLSGCSLEVLGTGIWGDQKATVRAANTEATVSADGTCTADVNLDPAILRTRQGANLMGRSECEIVRAKGRPAETIIRQEGNQRLVTLRYEENKTILSYIFKDNQLTQITR